jgi:hypothetical protein
MVWKHVRLRDAVWIQLTQKSTSRNPVRDNADSRAVLRERLYGSCSAAAVTASELAGVHRVRRRLAFKSVVETHERLVDVKQDSVV